MNVNIKGLKGSVTKRNSSHLLPPPLIQRSETAYKMVNVDAIVMS